MDERLAFIADSLKELEDKLRSYLENENAPHLYRGGRSEIMRQWLCLNLMKICRKPWLNG